MKPVLMEVDLYSRWICGEEEIPVSRNALVFCYSAIVYNDFDADNIPINLTAAVLSAETAPPQFA